MTTKNVPVAQNPHLVQAYVDYMIARQMVKQGMQGNACAARDRLRIVYRFIAGKPLQ